MNLACVELAVRAAHTVVWSQGKAVCVPCHRRALQEMGAVIYLGTQGI